MAITYLGQSTASSGSTVASINVPIPSGVVATDLLIAYVSLTTTTRTLTTPTGWTLLISEHVGAVEMEVYYKLAEASDVGATQTFAWTGGTSNCRATILAYNGVNQTDPVELGVGSGTTSNGTTHAIDASSVVAAGRGLAVYHIVRNTDITWATTPSGYTHRINNFDVHDLQILEDEITGAGNLGTLTSTSSTGTTCAYGAFIINEGGAGNIASSEAFGSSVVFPSIGRLFVDDRSATASSTSVTCDIPGNVIPGDLLLATFVNSTVTVSGYTLPSGFTEIAKSTLGSSSNLMLAAYKVADGSEAGGTATISCPSGNLTMNVSVWRGLTLDPLIGSVVAASTLTTHPVDFSSLYPETGEGLFITAMTYGSSESITDPSGYTRTEMNTAFEPLYMSYRFKEQSEQTATITTGTTTNSLTFGLAFNVLPNPGAIQSSETFGTPEVGRVTVVGKTLGVGNNISPVVGAVPANTVVGDLLLAFVSADSGTITTPSGWNVAQAEFVASGQNYRHAIFWKAATSGDTPGSSISVTIGGGDASIAVFALRNADLSIPVIGTATLAEAVASTSHTLDASGIVPASEGLAFFIAQTALASITAIPSGFIAEYSEEDATDRAQMVVSRKAVPPGAMSSALTFTSSLSRQAVATAIAIRGMTRAFTSSIASGESFGTASVSSAAGSEVRSYQQQVETLVGLAPTDEVRVFQYTVDVLVGDPVDLDQSVSPTGISSAQAIGTAKLVVYLVTSAIGSGEALGSPTVDLEDLIQPTGISSAEAFGSATADYPYTINTAGGIASEEAFGGATLSAGGAIYPTGIVSGEFVSDPSLIIDQTVSPAAFTGGEAFGGANVALDQEIDPAGIPSAQVVSTPTIDTSATGSPLSRPILRYYGSPLEEIFFDTGSYSVASRSFYDDPSLLFTGIPSGEAFGIAFVEGGDKIILATGIPGAEDFGAFIFEFVVYPPSIPSGEAFGTPGTPQVISLDGDGIASAEAFGSLSVTSLIRVSAGIPSVASVSTPQIFISRSGGNSPWPKTQQWSVYLAYSNRFSPATIGQPVTIAELVHAQGFKLDMILNRPGSLSLTTIMDDERAQYITPVNTALIAVRDGIVRWSGPVWTVDRDYAAGTINVSAVGWLEMLEHRRLRADIPEITSNDDLRVAEIFSAINAQTSSQGALLPAPLVYGGHFGTTQSRYHQEHSSGQQMGQLIHELIEIENGFDVKVDPVTRVMTTHRELIYSGFSSSHLWTADDYATAGSWYGESLVHFESWIPTVSGTITLQPPLVDPSVAGPNQDYYIFEGEAPDRIGTPMVDVFLADAWADGLSSYNTDTFDVVAGQIYTVAFADYGGMAAVGNRGSLSEWIGSIEDFGGAPEDVNSSYEIRGYGSDRPEAYFGYNVGPDNLSGFTQNIDASELANTVNAVGDKGNTVSVDDNESLVRYGCFEEDFSMTGTGIGPEAEQRLTVGAAAEVFFRKEPRNTYNITPKSWTEGGSVPRLFDDYDIGDIIRFGARRSSFVIPEDLDAGGVQYARVFGVTVSVDQNGNEAISSLKLANA